MIITAAVVEEKSGPFQLRELELEEPRADEIVVRMVAAGICHSDLAVRDQYLPIPLPIVLGHEGAGVVEAVGSGVTAVVPGDRVLLNAQSCGNCEACVAGRMFACDRGAELNFSGGRPDGSTGLSADGAPVHGKFFGQSSFATHALAHGQSVTVLPADLDLTLAPAFGCGVLTGAGAVMSGLRAGIGDTIVVFGTGGVGLAAVMAARAVGCTTVVAVDRVQARLDLARELGATHAVLAGGDGPDLLERVRAVVPAGAHHSVETTGVPEVSQAAVFSLRNGGMCAQLGVPPLGTTVGLDMAMLALSGIGIRGITSGGVPPRFLQPRLIELYRQGRFPVDKLVTHYPFADIELAARDSQRGTSVKPILLFGES
ncbi:NAD(P)-dependent alcohol dehydrogenase [Streptomyces sp. NPDC047061]|uniref:NAD(P)-dependent alcohol dehydrogenase n=1 Tax=Streptomyces sp. NPDC047061 TaxID=3154605 RepID=UPI0033D25771